MADEGREVELGDGGRGGLHTKTTLFPAHPFTAPAAREGNKINSMAWLIRVTQYYDFSFKGCF